MEAQDGIEIPPEQLIEPQYVDFTIMLVGGSGQGKTTFTRSFFGVEDKTKEQGKTEFIMPSTTEIATHEPMIKKTSVPHTFLRLSVIDTPGYGNDPDVAKSFRVILNKIGELNKQYKLKSNPDPRVHLVFYFLPTPRVKLCDTIFIELLQKVAFVIPIISKADTLRAIPADKNELSEYRTKVTETLEALLKGLKALEHLKSQLVYAVVNATKTEPRSYGWGSVDPWSKHADMFDNVALATFISKNFREIRSQVEKYYKAWETDGIPPYPPKQKRTLRHYVVVIVGIVLYLLVFGLINSNRKQ